MEMKRCLILYAALKSAIYLLSWSCNPGAIKFYERLGLVPYKIGMETLFHKTFGCCRFLYNHMLADRKEMYEKTGKTKRLTPA